MKTWKDVLLLVIGAVVLVDSAYSADPYSDREKKYADELERPSEDALQVQRKWDEIRRVYSEAMYVDLGLTATKASEEKVIEKLSALLQQGASVDTFDDEALETAIRAEAILVANFLLEKGANPDGYRSDGKPLKIATRFGKREFINLLNQHRAKPLRSSEAAQLRFMLAANHGNLQSMKRELSNGANINFIDSLEQTTALIEAVSFGRLEVVKLLLNLRGDPKGSGCVHRFDYVGLYPLRLIDRPVTFCTPLHAATQFEEQSQILRLLLKAGAPVSSTKCYKSLTPLHLAAKFHNVAAASLLLKTGAKVMPKDSDGNTPLDYTESGPMIKLLKAYGAREFP